jgi:hypothetical protein
MSCRALPREQQVHDHHGYDPREVGLHGLGLLDEDAGYS